MIQNFVAPRDAKAIATLSDTELSRRARIGLVGAVTFMVDLIGRFDEDISRISAEVEKRQKEFDNLLREEREKNVGLIVQLTKARSDMANLSCNNRV